MKKSQYTEEQIAYTLHEAEMGTPVAELCRKLGISEQTSPRGHPAGKRNMLAWVWPNYGASSSWKKKPQAQAVGG